MTNALTLNANNPILDFLKDFDRHNFFHFNDIIDWTDNIPTLKNSLFASQGFPRVSIKNVSTKEEDRLLFMFALPGWGHDNSKFDVSLEDGMLKISGKLTPEEDITKEEEKSECYGKEYARNISLKESFNWNYMLSPNTEFESATLKDGLLRIIVKVPQPNKPKPKTITVG